MTLWPRTPTLSEQQSTWPDWPDPSIPPHFVLQPVPSVAQLLSFAFPALARPEILPPVALSEPAAGDLLREIARSCYSDLGGTGCASVAFRWSFPPLRTGL